MSSGRQNCQTKESTIDVAAAQQQRETLSEAAEGDEGERMKRQRESGVRQGQNKKGGGGAAIAGQ